MNEDRSIRQEEIKKAQRLFLGLATLYAIEACKVAKNPAEIYQSANLTELALACFDSATSEFSDG